MCIVKFPVFLSLKQKIWYENWLIMIGLAKKNNFVNLYVFKFFEKWAY